jgi:4-hydroxy-tetrahydrodipicolinate synthase
MPLHEVMFIESNPGPVKYAVSRLGFGTGEMRLPMVPISDAARKAVDKVLSDLDLIDARAAE